MACCGIDQSHHKCVDMAYNDQHCAKLYECCGAIHDAGLQAKCLSRVRDCRKLGNAWDPIRPLKPMDAYTMFTDKPGYTTQGALVEGFGAGLSLQCVLKGSVYGVLIGLLVKTFIKRDITTERILGISVLGALIQCMLATMR